MKKIVLGTSLAPGNYGTQLSAVKSWINNGFHVVSCNTREELLQIREHFIDLGVEFVEVGRDAKNVASKPLPYIQDILNVVSQKTESICGYINSDIILSNMSNDLYKYIMEEAQNSLLFVRRNEINKEEDINTIDWQIHFDGIDLFFIDKQLAKDFFDDGFYVQSLWDLCILVKCALLHIKIKELVNPIAFHIRHAIKWNFAVANILLEHFAKKYFNSNENPYKQILQRFYEIITIESEQVCFCNMEGYRLLVCSDEQNTIQGDYDFVIYVPKGIIYSNVFCKVAIFIMNQYNCSEMEFGCFFKIENTYCELNRNINNIISINKECNLYSKVFRRIGGEYKGRVHIPVVYETLSIDDSITDCIKIDTKIYLMPAGVRASEWYQFNSRKVKDIGGFIDNSDKKIGTEICDKMVYSIKSLDQNDEGCTVIVASKYYNKEIMNQLSTLVSVQKVIDASMILKIDDEGHIFFLNTQKFQNYRLKL